MAVTEDVGLVLVYDIAKSRTAVIPPMSPSWPAIQMRQLVSLAKKLLPAIGFRVMCVMDGITRLASQAAIQLRTAFVRIAWTNN